MPRIAVKDGLTREVTLTPKTAYGEPVAQSCTVKFRPASSATVLAFEVDDYVGDGAKQVTLLIDIVANHVVEWNFTDEDDKPISPTDRKLVAKIPIPYLIEIKNAILKCAYETATLLGN